jgi:hypothetical protein
MGLAAAISYFLLRGGSGRPDAPTQNLMACVLLAGSIWGTIYVAWTSYFRTITWKGNELRVRWIFGQESNRRLSDVADVKRMRGESRIMFRDGSQISFSEHMHGAKDLNARLPKRAFANGEHE